MYADDIQPVEQVLSETALFNTLFEVLVRGGNDTHIDLDGRVTADAVKLAVRKYAQQAGLHLRRHIADFVQEKRAPVGLLETSHPLGLRTRECATLMTELLRFQLVARYRRHIQGDERLVGARAVPV